MTSAVDSERLLRILAMLRTRTVARGTTEEEQDEAARKLGRLLQQHEELSVAWASSGKRREAEADLDRRAEAAARQMAEERRRQHARAQQEEMVREAERVAREWRERQEARGPGRQHEGSQTTTFRARVLKVTEKEVWVSTGRMGWVVELLKSMLLCPFADWTMGDEVTIELPTWLAREKGLAGEAQQEA